MTDLDWMMSGDSTNDINFYNWNRFFFIYCDGTGHQGYIKDTLLVQNQNLYFRGYNNTVAHLNFVFNLLPPQKTDTFVVNGCSAGGLAVYTWVDSIAEYIQATNRAVKVIGLADSGFFIDYPSFKTGTNDYTTNIKAVVQLVNYGQVPLPNARCMAENGLTNPHFCLMAEHLVKYIQTPLFLEESLYDTWQLDNILQIPCMQGWDTASLSNCDPAEMIEITKYKDHTATLLQEAFDFNGLTRSVWAPACPFHGYSNFGYVNDTESMNMTVPGNTN